MKEFSKTQVLSVELNTVIPIYIKIILSEYGNNNPEHSLKMNTQNIYIIQTQFQYLFYKKSIYYFFMYLYKILFSICAFESMLNRCFEISFCSSNCGFFTISLRIFETAKPG